VILEDGVAVASGNWNSSLEIISYSLDGLTPGIYNFTCIIGDTGGNWIADSVIVTVNAVTTTITTPTTSDTTTTTDTTTDIVTTDTEPTTPNPTNDQTMLLVTIGLGGFAIVIIIVVIMKKK
jgi:hypothetical protein